MASLNGYLEQLYDVTGPSHSQGPSYLYPLSTEILQSSLPAAFVSIESDSAQAASGTFTGQRSVSLKRLRWKRGLISLSVDVVSAQL